MSRLTDPIVLAIDSDVLSLSATKATLNEYNYDVFVATTAESAKQIASQLDIDLLICAKRIQYRSGERLVAEIKQLPDRQDVPVIFGSDTQRLDVVCRRHSFGQAYHLKKPFRADVLAEFVEQVLWIPDFAHHDLNHPHFYGQSPKTVGNDQKSDTSQTRPNIFPSVHMPVQNINPSAKQSLPSSLTQMPDTNSFF